MAGPRSGATELEANASASSTVTRTRPAVASLANRGAKPLVSSSQLRSAACKGSTKVTVADTKTAAAAAMSVGREDDPVLVTLGHPSSQ